MKGGPLRRFTDTTASQPTGITGWAIGAVGYGARQGFPVLDGAPALSTIAPVLSLRRHPRADEWSRTGGQRCRVCGAALNPPVVSAPVGCGRVHHDRAALAACMRRPPGVIGGIVATGGY